MVVNSLDCGCCEENHPLACRHTSRLVGKTGTQCIQEEPLKGMVIKCTESIGDVKAVVSGVEYCCYSLSLWMSGNDGKLPTVKPFVHVHSTMKEILPRIQNKNR